ncbi:hypothetical protein JIN85_00730 [Luteolibacter pohnpeiensis]|uniref:Uncharacterized protein n=1 Tax=Luteolibacter pohnpeiensis TaxID=454153 RepID=A0A934S0B7_9BACT|nr:hypothetical protein [Luteolibacter pohnpeiensis]
MPKQISHPLPWAILLFVMICFAIGLLFHTTLGKIVGRSLEKGLLEKIPGYPPLRSIARQLSDSSSCANFQPVLAEVEDGCLTPALLVESHQGGLSTIFIPSAPTPLAGAIFIMPSHRVHPAEVPITEIFKCVSKWGAGSGAILASSPHSTAASDQRFMQSP